MSATAKQETICITELRELRNDDFTLLQQAGVHSIESLVQVGVFRLQDEFGISDGVVYRINQALEALRDRLVNQVHAVEVAQRSFGGRTHGSDTTANMEVALAEADPDVAREVRERAEDIADKRRRAGSSGPATTRRVG